MNALKIVLIILGIYLLMGLLGFIFDGGSWVNIFTWPVEFAEAFARGWRSVS